MNISAKTPQLARARDESPSDTWRARRGNGKNIVGYEAVRSAAAKWQPFDSLQVAEPRSAQFVPVIESPEFSPVAYRGAIRKHRASLAIAMFSTVVFVALSFFKADHQAIRLATALALLTGFLWVDYLTVVRNFDALRGRSLFFINVCVAGRAAVLWSTAFMLLTGMLQFYLENSLGGHDATLLRFGTVYDSVTAGEWWRLLIGPFLHGSVAHWITNAVFLVFVAPLAAVRSHVAAIVVFLTGCVVAAVAAFAVSRWTTGDVYVGVSGGIFALFSFVAVVGHGPGYPPAFRITMGMFAALNFLMAAILLPNASNAGHAGGLAAGALCGAVYWWKNSRA